MSESSERRRAPNAWIVTATYNEAQNLPELIDTVLELPVPVRICIVDDNSPDGTGRIADEYAHRQPEKVTAIHRDGKLGYASAHRRGMRKVMDMGAETIITMDADLSHEPSRVPTMLEELSDADVVIGSRYTRGGSVENWSAFRIFLSRFGGVVTRLLTGLNYTDPTSGFRAYRKDILQRANPWTTTARGYGFLVEVLFRCQRLGAGIVETPITYRDRQAGRSKLSKRIIFESALLCFRLFFQRFVHPSGKQYRETTS